MNPKSEQIAAAIQANLGDRLLTIPSTCGELTYEVAAADLLEICTALRDQPELKFEMLVDLCGVDYMDYGKVQWSTRRSSGTGFSRAVNDHATPPGADGERRFAVVYHLLSISHNTRIRLRVFAGNAEVPMVDSLTGVWSSANWFEREAFDLFGILFKNHPDLRRILTDYGFIGHPFRKDFPLIGNVEVRYDPEKGRVIYQPVSIEPRTLVPRVIRDDHRYEKSLKEPGGNG
ncbi:MAG: NADH-quinone oxidoreductase subunit C [Gammaproteobacteria bacterium]|nr:NADH-quinone oxidoreductase subunit C [Gammaproteobacteria bacterium]